MSRPDMVSPRPLRPGGLTSFSISFMGTEQVPLTEGTIIGPQTVRGQYNGMMPNLHPPPPQPPPQPGLYIEKAEKKKEVKFSELVRKIEESGGAEDPKAVAAVQHKKMIGKWPAEKAIPAAVMGAAKTGAEVAGRVAETVGSAVSTAADVAGMPGRVVAEATKAVPTPMAFPDSSGGAVGSASPVRSGPSPMSFPGVGSAGRAGAPSSVSIPSSSAIVSGSHAKQATGSEAATSVGTAKLIGKAMALIDEMIESYPFAKALQQHAECLSKAEAAAGPTNPELGTPEMQLARHQAAVIHLTERGHAHRNIGDHALANKYFTAAQQHHGRTEELARQGVQLKGGEHEAWMEHYRDNPEKYSGHAGGDASQRAGAHLVATSTGISPLDPKLHEPAGSAAKIFYEARHSMAHPEQKVDPGQTTAGLESLRKEARQQIKQKLARQPGKPGETMIGYAKEKMAPQKPVEVSPRMAPRKPGFRGVTETGPPQRTALTAVEKPPTRPPLRSRPPAPVGPTAETGAFRRALVVLPIEGLEPLGKPIPKRKKEESKKEYASDVIRMMMHEGRPQKQAIAIGLRQAGMARKSVPLMIWNNEEPRCALAVVF